MILVSTNNWQQNQRETSGTRAQRGGDWCARVALA
jgi:hypothetical protein